MVDTSGSVKRRVSYFYDPDIGNYHYGQGHPMKVNQSFCFIAAWSKNPFLFQPHRVRMTHNLIVNYGLFRKMDCFRPKLVSASQLTRFHSDDYINFLRLISPGFVFLLYFWCNCDLFLFRQYGRLYSTIAALQCWRGLSSFRWAVRDVSDLRIWIYW